VLKISTPAENQHIVKNQYDIRKIKRFGRGQGAENQHI